MKLNLLWTYVIELSAAADTIKIYTIIFFIISQLNYITIILYFLEYKIYS